MQKFSDQKLMWMPVVLAQPLPAPSTFRVEGVFACSIQGSLNKDMHSFICSI